MLSMFERLPRSGECDVATFDQQLNQYGEGVVSPVFRRGGRLDDPNLRALRIPTDVSDCMEEFK